MWCIVTIDKWKTTPSKYAITFGPNFEFGLSYVKALYFNVQGLRSFQCLSSLQAIVLRLRVKRNYTSVTLNHWHSIP